MNVRAITNRTPNSRSRVATFTRFALLLQAAYLLSCHPPAPRYDFDKERQATQSFAVAAGDVLLIHVWKNEALSQRVTVRPDGFVTLPLIGDIATGGRTVTAIAEDIQEKARTYYTEPPVVSVEVAEVHGYRIYVLGEVTRPGELTPRGRISVLQALALAGGFTRFASPDEIQILRRDHAGERRIPFAFREVVERGDLREDIPLQTADTVIVP